ncbi:MAG: phosphatidate cytidylyltransferase [Alphaproteobacteria bacterium]|nr:phosphatidate cytidylyltransferase [Alphaproteobacteria bacterium]
MSAVQPDTSLALRVQSGAVLILVTLTALWFGAPTFNAYAAILAGLMLYEGATVAKLDAAVQRLLWSGAAPLLVVIGLLLEDRTMMQLVCLTTFFLAFVLYKRSSLWAAGIFAVPMVALLSAVYVYEVLGAAGMLTGLVIIWAADTAAYLTGRRYGKRPLWPSVSPKKTWEGLYGGLVAAILASAAARYFQVDDFSLNDWGAAIGLGLGIAALATLSDLAESAFKRRFNVKDSSNFIPGHGGFLDRLDSTLLPLPLAAVGLMVLEAWYQ